MGWVKHSTEKEIVSSYNAHYGCEKPRLYDYDDRLEGTYYQPKITEYAEIGDEWVCDICHKRWYVRTDGHSGRLYWEPRFWRPYEKKKKS